MKESFTSDDSGSSCWARSAAMFAFQSATTNHPHWYPNGLAQDRQAERSIRIQCFLRGPSPSELLYVLIVLNSCWIFKIRASFLEYGKYNCHTHAFYTWIPLKICVNHSRWRYYGNIRKQKCNLMYATSIFPQSILFTLWCTILYFCYFIFNCFS